MTTTATPTTMMAPHVYDQNLRHLQEDAMRPILGVSIAVGLGMILIVADQFREAWQGGLLGLILVFFSAGAYWSLARHYLTSAWLLLAGWLISILAGAIWLPNVPVACLLALPVGLATFFIGVRAGMLTGLAVSAVAWLPVRVSGTLSEAGYWQITAISIWGVYILTWLALRPTETAIRWSWHSYIQARQELESARDVQAELKQAIQNLADANAQMARLNLMLGAARRAAEEAERAKAEFAANVSHELRTPLNLIIGFSEMILYAPETYGLRLPQKLLADVAAIHRNSQHLVSLINDVLDISQIEARRMTLIREWVALPEILDAAVLAVRPLLEARGLYLQVNLPDDLPPVYCDRTRIRQVLLNLFSNASRFTQVGGLTIGVERDARQVTVTVTDTGIGIAEGDLPKLFEPFRQLESSVRGKQVSSGLGLNISKRFVELHDGQMGARSQLQVGSSFWFSLPLEPDAINRGIGGRWLNPDWEPQRRSSLTPRLRSVPRMVVLESRDVLHEAATRYLDDIEAISAATAAEARELLAAAPAKVVLVRGESPEQTAAWVDELHDTRYATPLVACSLPAHNTADEMGITRYLTKPVTRGQLVEAVEAVETPVHSILIADDNLEALQLFSRILSAEPRSYRILQATDGQETLELLKARKPDLLLLDLMMPNMDGFAVLAEKNRDPDLRAIPTLVLSARDPDQPLAFAPSMLVTRNGGLSVTELLRCAMSVSEILWIPHPEPGSTLPARQSA